MEPKKSEVILLIEISRPNGAMARILEQLGFEVAKCENGPQALELLASGKNFSVVISDIELPDMSGLELLKKMRSSLHTKEIQFFLMASLSESHQIIHAVDLDVNGYFLKPVTHQRVQKKMQELFPYKFSTKASA